MDSVRSYLVCGVARNGSHLLSAALKSTGVAGLPREYFAPARADSVAREEVFAGFEASAWARDRSLTSFPAYFDAILREGRSANGVFGASIQWNGFELLIDKLRVFTPYGGNATYRSLLRRNLGMPRFLYLTRRDRMRQAVSWALAEPTSSEASFDAERLDKLVGRIEEAERGWESLFDVIEVEPFRLVYEDWTEDVPKAVEACLRWLGLWDTAAHDATSLPTRRSAPKLEDEWTARYRALRPGAH